MTTTLLNIRQLSISFNVGKDDIPAVTDLNFSVDRGETVALVGESGSGKSVTALSIMQLLAPNAHYSDGTLTFQKKDGRSVDLLKCTTSQLERIRGNEIGMIFQEPMSSLNPVLTCGSQVQEALRIHQPITIKEARSKTIELFAKMELPDPEKIMNRYPHQLSGGQKQRVMIAMAMCSSPSLLIADEPTTALDVTVQQSILKLMKQLQQEYGMGLLFITHDLGIVQEIANKVIVLYKGALVEQGNVNDVFQQPKHPYTKALLACRPVLYSKGQRLALVRDFLNPDRSKIDSPSVIDTPTPTNIRNETEPFAAVQNLTVRFPGTKHIFEKSADDFYAVKNVSFEIKKGETVGLVGESGSGKTTIGRCLVGLTLPSAGSVFFEGNNLLELPEESLKNFRKKVQIVFQDPYASLNPRMKIGEILMEPLLVHRIYNTRKRAREAVVSLLEKVHLNADSIFRYPHEFSGGQRQRIVIARALALQPSLIVWDESVSALDVSVQAQILNLLNELKKEMGFSSLFISHDLSVVRYISDRILVMKEGQIVESGTADDVYHHPQNAYTQKLIDAIPGKKGLPTLKF
ncbi:MAG: ABC transporter ATP-binding protein [Lacibacter sp.]